MYSVLMSVYAKEKPEYLQASIESVLTQTLATDDFVIVCDGPLTDELEKVLSHACKSHAGVIRICRLAQNVGLGKALNEGLKICKNEIVARMDSDDISFPERMEKEYARMTENELDLVSASLIEFSESIHKPGARRELPQEMSEILKFAKKRNPFNHPAVMYKKSSVLAVGGYQDYPYFEDYQLWLRMLGAGMQAQNIKEPLLYMRTGDGMILRRGGAKYVKAIWKFRSFQRKSGWIGWLDFLILTSGHSVVALLPGSLRRLFYEKLLRKK